MPRILSQFCWQNVCRMLAGRHIRIAVAMAAQLALQNVISKTADHLDHLARGIRQNN